MTFERRATRTLAVAALVFGLSASVAAAKDCDGFFLFDAKPRLTLEEAIKLAGDWRTVDASDRFALVVNATDEEWPPQRGQWWGLAMVYSIVDGGQDVIGGVLWTKDRGAFGTWGGMTLTKGKDGAYVTFKPVVPVQGCRNGFTIRLDKNGVLYANGVRVGATPTLY